MRCDITATERWATAEIAPSERALNNALGMLRSHPAFKEANVDEVVWCHGDDKL